MKSFDGNVLFLDRSDINTDEIIPARYLTESTKEALGPHLLEDLNLDGFDAKRDLPGKQVIVSRSNFGCGSSREHAPWALEVNGIHMVVAESYARIFRQNMFNCGMMAVELSPDAIADLFTRFQGKSTRVVTNLEEGALVFSAGADTATFSFRISDFDRKLVEAGGWVNFADARY
ncbi:MAG: 3-isopropylmalate dehydratase small subunit [Desulfobacterales bacterium]